MKLEHNEKPVKAPNPTPLEEIYDGRPAHEIEKELIDKAESAAIRAAEKMAPEDMAAMFFQQFYPQFEASLNGMSKKELVRVCAALVHYPLENIMPKTQLGDQATGLGLRLIDAKLVMRETIAIQEREKLTALEKEKLVEDTQAIINSAQTSFQMGEKAND